MIPFIRMRWRHRSRPAFAKNGFTLLELLVVLAIIGAVLTVVPVLLSGRFGDASIATVEDQLIADLRLSRGKAIMENSPTSLVIDGDFAGYVLLPSRQQRRLPDGFRIVLRSASDGTAEKVQFYPDGTTTGGRLQIALGDDRYPIDVTWPTGRIRRGE